MQGLSPKAVAIYIRWSTDEQTEGTTLETQQERCRLYIRSQGWDVREDLVFVDEGYSGGSLHRPALTKLREAAKAGRVDCVVAYSIDRLSRNLADITQLIQTEWMGRCSFRSASQPISTDEGNPTGQLVFNVLASFAEFERGLIRERTHAGSVRRARQGKYPGGRVAPLGYVRDGIGSLAVDETKAPIIRRIFEMATTGPHGQGPTVMARQLNKMGIPAPAGGKWWAACVREILRNPIYVGVVTYGRRKSNPAHQRDKSIPRQVRRKQPLSVVDDAAPALIDREVWNRVQAQEVERAKIYTKKGVQAQNRALLTGLLVCKCGGPLHVFHKEQGRYYRCSRNAQAGGCKHQPGIYRLEALEKLVVDEVMARYGSEELRAGALAKIAERLSTQNLRTEQERTLADVNRRIDAAKADLARLRKAARAGEIQLATYEELKADVDAELRELQETSNGAKIALSNITEGQSSLSAWRRTLSQVDLWADLDDGRRREIIYGLMRQVCVFRQKGTSDAITVEMIWEEAR